MEVKSSHWRIEDKWIESNERRILCDSLFARRPSPLQSSLIDEKKIKPDFQLVTYKIAVVGKSAVGKTCTTMSLTGRNPSHKYVETSGIQVFDISWPIKIEDQSRVWLVTMELWDTAATSVKTNEATAHSLTDDADALLHVCSAVDSKSLTELLPQLEEHNDLLPQAVIMTKCDEWSKRQISDIELRSSVSGIGNGAGAGILTSSLANLPVPSTPFYIRPEISMVLTQLALLLLQRKAPTKR